MVAHLIGMNLVFVAMLAGDPAPSQDSIADADLLTGFRHSSESLLTAFSEPGVLERTFEGPLGKATGLERLRIRLYDLLAHGWDIAKALGQPADLPSDAASDSLDFARRQVKDEARPGRFSPAQPVPSDAPAIDRLVGFLGRSSSWGRPASG